MPRTHAKATRARLPDHDRRSGHLPNDPAEAVAALVHTHGPRLHALALRLCRHRADAEDMVQNTFMQALRKWHTFRGESDPGTWLYTIAARMCKARIRRKGGIDRRQIPVSQLMPWSESTVMEVAAAPDGREDPGERSEAIALVQSQIPRLPEHLRLPLVLKEVVGMSIEDVAAALGLTANTVKTRLHRARLALRKAVTAKAARVDAPEPIYEKSICLDLLKAKMEAMDRGGVTAGLRVPQAEVCARCRAVFREFDLMQDACSRMLEGEFPTQLRTKILRALHDRDAAERGAIRTRRGRRPVAGRARP